MNVDAYDKNCKFYNSERALLRRPRSAKSYYSKIDGEWSVGDLPKKSQTSNLERFQGTNMYFTEIPMFTGSKRYLCCTCSYSFAYKLHYLHKNELFDILFLKKSDNLITHNSVLVGALFVSSFYRGGEEGISTLHRSKINIFITVYFLFFFTKRLTFQSFQIYEQQKGHSAVSMLKLEIG